jgi:hypothetical protein
MTKSEAALARSAELWLCVNLILVRGRTQSRNSALPYAGARTGHALGLEPAFAKASAR